jgi:hypothetical protein
MIHIGGAGEMHRSRKNMMKVVRGRAHWRDGEDGDDT